MFETAAVWDDAKNVETLTSMWTEGASASEIARALGQDVTRAAVIGKVHRLKLPQRSKDAITAQSVTSRASRRGSPGQANIAGIIHRKKGRAAAAEDARTRGIVAARDHVPFRAGSNIDLSAGVDVTGLIGFSDRRIGKQCAWIPGDPIGGAMCCGKPVKDGSEWCHEHYARVYKKVGAI